MSRTPIALVTGASRGLGRVLARTLFDNGWQVIVDGRDAGQLTEANESFAVTIPGDITEPAHREALAATVQSLGHLELLVNNASELGPSPLPRLADHPIYVLRRLYEINVIAPLALTQLLLPWLRANSGIVINLSSDAAVEAYEGWGGYGSTKAALDHLSAVLTIEEPQLRVYAVDPGDMRTDMHQRAYPGQDISDRPLPETIVPSFMRLLDARPESGRYRASEWLRATDALTVGAKR